MSAAGLDVTVMLATAHDDERMADVAVPGGGSPVVVCLLPAPKQVELMRGQEERSFDYHCIQDASYSMLSPLAFDADKFVEAVLAYCRAQPRVQATMAFDCFPTMLSSVINQELSLPGPSFRSVFCCCNKFYMRQELSPSIECMAAKEAPPSTVPCVLKVSDTQFYVGTRICLSGDEWGPIWEALSSQLLTAEHVSARQRFYFKWAAHFGWAERYGWSAPSDVRLVHTEPLITNRGEYQAEVIVLSDGTMEVADTGDIEHGPGQLITLFKTPGTVRMTPKLRAWLHHIVAQLASLGYRSAAMDVEFMRLRAAEEAYELVEINSRYSYMGNYLHFGVASEAHVGVSHTVSSRHHEVRNLLNRTRLALGVSPATLPSRDNPDVSKLAAMVYTDRLGPLDTIIDKGELETMVGDGTLDAFAPKPAFLRGVVTEIDRREYNGWAKVGCILLTMENDNARINARLDAIIRRLFRDGGFLPVEVVDEDGEGPTGLRHDMLYERAPLDGLRDGNPGPRARCCLLS